MRRFTTVSSTSTSTSTSFTIITLLTFLITTVLSSFTPIISTSIPQLQQNENENADPLRPQPRTTKPFLLRIMPLGASITVGYRSSDGNGYRKVLREQLRYAGWEVDMVGSLTNGTMKDNQNEGHFGATIDEVESSAIHSAKLQPNVILINVGTNDGLRNVRITGAGQRIDDLLTHLFDAIPNTTIILSTLLPNTQVQRVVERVSTEYRHVAARRREQGYRVVLAEMSYFLRADQLVDDTHPDDTGYRAMAAVWWAAIQQAEMEGMIVRPNSIIKSPVSVLSGGNETREGEGLDDGPITDPGLPAYVAPAQPEDTGGAGAGGFGELGKGLWVALGVQVLCECARRFL